MLRLFGSTIRASKDPPVESREEILNGEVQERSVGGGIATEKGGIGEFSRIGDSEFEVVESGEEVLNREAPFRSVEGGSAVENGEFGEAAGTWVIEIEAKTFSYRKSIDGCLFKEVHRKWEREIPMSIDQLKWMGEILLTRSKEFGNRWNERSSKHFDEGLVTVREGRNSWGVYLTFQFGRGLFLTFPAGYGGKEWGRVSLWILRLMEPSGSQQTEVLHDSSKCSEKYTQEASVGFSVSDVHMDDLNWRLEKLLEELKFFRFSVTELCSSESNDCLSESNVSVSLSSNDGCLDPCMDLWRNDECEDSGSTLSWEELRGCSEKERVSGSKDDDVVSEGYSSDSPTGEEDADVAWSLVKRGLTSNSMFAEVQKLTSTINAGGTTMVFEISNYPARFEKQLQLLGEPDHSMDGSDVCVDFGSIMDNQQVSTPVSVHPQISYLEALSMLCRGSTLDQTPTALSLEKGIEEAAVVEEEDESDSWSMFIADNFHCEKGCLRPAWERVDNCEVIEALMDEGVDLSDVEEEDD